VGRPTAEQVKGLAADDGSLRAAGQLAVAAPWSELGHNERAVWGACRGSGKAPYRVVVDTSGPAYRCSCLSRKFPCKHALGLLLLWARGAAAVAEARPPAEAAAWLATRSAKARQPGPAGEARAVAEPGDEVALGASDGAAAPRQRAVVDLQAAAVRVSQRAERIAVGMAELDRWLADMVASGLAQAQGRPFSYWDAMAARLVDAQAPAAATQVRRLAGVVRSGDGWPGRLLAQSSRLHLLASGWSRYESLPEAQKADLRTAAGWPWPSEQVLAGARERDRWYVLARSETEEERVTALRTWLWGIATNKLALVLDFARPGASPAWELWPGNVVDAAVARFPGSSQLRVLVAERNGEAEVGGAPPAWADLGQVAEARGEALASDPWADRWPVSVAGVVPERRGANWAVTDREGRSVALATDDAVGWRLLASSGGRPVGLLAEWVADSLVPLGAWTDGAMVVL
jgi:hypothetical protein